MFKSTCLLVGLNAVVGLALATALDKPSASPQKPADGVYAVLRDSLQEADVLPLKEKEVLVVNRYRYMKQVDQEPPRYLVIGPVPDVELKLAGKPQADKEGAQVVRILLKLEPSAAKSLEKLTADRLGRQLVIVVGGEVVTMHKIREVIKSGNVQITSCAVGAANFLLEQLQAHPQQK